MKTREKAAERPKGKDIDLCRPCACALEAEGRILTPVRKGVDLKVTCERCKRRRYGMTYALEK